MNTKRNTPTSKEEESIQNHIDLGFRNTPLYFRTQDNFGPDKQQRSNLCYGGGSDLDANLVKIIGTNLKERDVMVVEAIIIIEQVVGLSLMAGGVLTVGFLALVLFDLINIRR